MNELTKIESSILAECETVIERGLSSFIDVGNALLKIRDGRLYKAEFATFEEYCRERWGMSRIHAHRLIESAGVVENLLPIGNIVPANEAQARPLVSLSPAEQVAAWQEVRESGKPITAALVESIAKPHVSHNGGENEWYTPSEFIEAARKTMGSIDTDPASSEIANRTVQAKIFYTKETNGLEQVWTGNVWMNPPYAQPLIQQFTDVFLEKLDSEFEQGIILVNNATETSWFQSLLEYTSAICFIKTRVKFLDPQGNPGAPLQGQAVLYFGKNIAGFTKSFERFGKVLYA